MNCKHEKTHWTEKVNYFYWHSNDSFSTIERCSDCGLEWNEKKRNETNEMKRNETNGMKRNERTDETK